MRSLLLVAFALVSLLASPGLALSEAPTGFADIAWGTPKDDVKKALTKRCRAMKEMTDSSVICPSYELEGLGKVDLTLDFVDGELRGYRIEVPMGRRNALLGAASGKFGSPASLPRRGATSPWHWVWPGGTSTYVEIEPPLNKAVLGVSQNELARARKQEMINEAERLKKGL